jgi:nucleoid-associated protein YejK
VPSFIKLEYHIVLVGGRETLEKKYTIAQFVPKEDRSIKLDDKFSISGAYIAFKFEKTALTHRIQYEQYPQT